MELRSTWAVTFPGWIGIAPVLGHGRMYVRAAGLLVCLDPDTGGEHWRVTVDPDNDSGRVLAVCGDWVVTSRHVDHSTRLIGVDRDGAIGWETQTATVIVDAFGCVGERFAAFGARGRETLMHAVDPQTGAVSVARVDRRPDSFFVRGGRLYCTRRVSPGMFSVRAEDGADERIELEIPVFSVADEPPRLLLTTQTEAGYFVEVCDADLRRVWSRPVGSPIAALQGDTVVGFDAAQGKSAPVLVGADDGALIRRGPALPDEPLAVSVLDRLIAIGDLTDLRLFALDDLAEVATYSMARHAVQAGPLVVITQTDRIEGFEDDDG